MDPLFVDGSENVGVFHQLQAPAISQHLLFEFALLRMGGSVVAHRRRHQEPGGFAHQFGLLQIVVKGWFEQNPLFGNAKGILRIFHHLPGAFDPNHVHRRNLSGLFGRDIANIGTHRIKRRHQRLGHLAAGEVAEIPHLIDPLDRPAACDDDAAVFPIVVFKKRFQRRGEDRERVGHRPVSLGAAGQQLLLGLYDLDPPQGQPFEIGHGSGMLDHPGIGGRGDEGGTAVGQGGLQKQIIGDAGGHFVQRIGRGGGDNEAVGPLPYSDVIVTAMPTFALLMKHGIACEGFES